MPSQTATALNAYPASEADAFTLVPPLREAVEAGERLRVLYRSRARTRVIRGRSAY
jgi:hypothetical protein